MMVFKLRKPELKYTDHQRPNMVSPENDSGSPGYQMQCDSVTLKMNIFQLACKFFQLDVAVYRTSMAIELTGTATTRKFPLCWGKTVRRIYDCLQRFFTELRSTSNNGQTHTLYIDIISSDSCGGTGL